MAGDASNPFSAGNAPGGGIVDLVSTNKGGVQVLGQIYQALIGAFPRVNGTFALSAATTTVVTQPAVAANAIVLWSPVNATAALLERTTGLFHATTTAGVGFTMSTQSGSASAGSVFSYVVINPV